MMRSLCWWEGYEACKRGVAKTRNPYLAAAKLDPEKPQTMDYMDWREGWEKFFFGEDPNVEP